MVPTPHLFSGTESSNSLADFPAISAYLIGSFKCWLNGSHTNFYLVEEVVPTCLKQHRQGHACGAHEREIAKLLNVFLHRFSSFLDYREKLIHGHLSVILVKSRKEPGFQVDPRIDRAVGKAYEPVKGYSFKSADE